MTYTFLDEMMNRIFHQAVARDFPKKCSCGERYKDELDYLKRTKRTGNARLYEIQEDRGVIHFLRNCRCDSTLCVEVDYKSELITPDDFREYIDMLAEQEKDSLSQKIHQHKSMEELRQDRTLVHLLGAIGSDEKRVFLQHPISGLGRVKKEEWFEVGLCRFRDNYNHWLRDNVMPR